MPNQNKPSQQRLPLKQVAYEYIKNRILSCEYEPGTFLNEQQICDVTGLSRTPVRDALGRLEQEGLVNILPKKGVLVSPLKLSDINRLYEVRLLLEPYAIQRYGHLLDQEKLKEFAALQNEAQRAEQDAGFFYELDDQLHDFFISAMNNRYLQDTYENTKNLNRRLRVLSGDKVENRVADTFREHGIIIDACLRSDWEAAAKAMVAHLEASRVSAFQLMIDNADNT